MNSRKQFQLHFDFYSTLVYLIGRVKKQLTVSLIDSSLHVSCCHRYLTNPTQLPTTHRKLPHAEFLVCVAAGIHFAAYERERLLNLLLLEGVRSSLILRCRGDKHES